MWHRPSAHLAILMMTDILTMVVIGGVALAGWVGWIVWDVRRTLAQVEQEGGPKNNSGREVISNVASAYNLGPRRGESWWWWRRGKGWWRPRR